MLWDTTREALSDVDQPVKPVRTGRAAGAMRHRRVSSNVYVGVMNSEARLCSPQFSVETSEMLGDDRLNSRVRGWLVVGRRRPSSHFRCVAFQSSNVGVDILFSADGHSDLPHSVQSE